MSQDSRAVMLTPIPLPLEKHTNLTLRPFVLEACSASCLGHGHGYECRCPIPGTMYDVLVLCTSTMY